MSDGRINNGGVRKGAGRKAKAYTLARRRLEAEKIEDAERAFVLFVAVMDDDEQALDMRLQAANWVAERVYGKPMQGVDARVRAAVAHDDVTGLSDEELEARIRALDAEFAAQNGAAGLGDTARSDSGDAPSGVGGA